MNGVAFHQIAGPFNEGENAVIKCIVIGGKSTFSLDRTHLNLNDFQEKLNFHDYVRKAFTLSDMVSRESSDR